MWRVPGEIIEKDSFIVYIDDRSKEFNTENMKEYEITDKFKEILISTVKKKESITGDGRI